MKIGTINIATLHKKEEEVVTLMKERKLDVLGLCETRREGKGSITIHDNYKLVWCGLPQEKRHGVAIVMTEEIAEGITVIEYVNERLLKVTLQMKNIKMTLIQVYAPQQGRPKQRKRRILSSTARNNRIERKCR